jgi:hypothetical protein
LKSAEVAGASARTIAAHIGRHAHARVRRIALCRLPAVAVSWPVGEIVKGLDAAARDRIDQLRGEGRFF